MDELLCLVWCGCGKGMSGGVLKVEFHRDEIEFIVECDDIDWLVCGGDGVFDFIDLEMDKAFAADEHGFEFDFLVEEEIRLREFESVDRAEEDLVDVPIREQVQFVLEHMQECAPDSFLDFIVQLHRAADFFYARRAVTNQTAANYSIVRLGAGLITFKVAKRLLKHLVFLVPNVVKQNLFLRVE